ncbi:GAF domain-containing protein [Pseudofulvibacter geojedonensis]|uniref:GAF domain-containing protein n=1 Tax=Pseudofulvibacter geojedonensis TaxID=1123758 RepID=A0ABW3I353_9FLAO
MNQFENLKPLVSTITRDITLSVFDRLKGVCQLLQDHLDAYDWVGFYFANHEKKTLHLSAYVGEPTDHLTIPFGKGICGQVAESNDNFVVPDVKAQDNYIACSITVKAEIVVPIFINGKNIGQIDIDSKTINPFNEDDERFLEFACKEVANLLDGIEIDSLLLEE